jgi:hypothetical protein
MLLGLLLSHEALALQKLTSLPVPSVALLVPDVAQESEPKLSELVLGICVHVLKSWTSIEPVAAV